MRLIHLLSLMALLVACSSEPDTVEGRWSCITTHPGGFQSSDIFHFLNNGQLTLDSDGMVMHGSYSLAKPILTMNIIDVPVPKGLGPEPVQSQTLTATLRKFSDKTLEMSVSTGQDSHLSQCQRQQ